MLYTDKELIDIFYSDSSRGIELVFRQYYETLCQTAVRITKESNLAEDIVQEVFFEFYKKKDTLKVESIIGYLKRSVYNRSLNKVRASRDFIDTDNVELEFHDYEVSSHEKIEYNELEQFLNEVIDSLPEKCRLVFVLNRHEQLSYKEVAEKLGISVKTVENQMSKALKILRIEYERYKNILEKEQMG